MGNKIEFKTIKQHFHESWHKELQPFIDSNECQEIFKKLQILKNEGKTLLPGKFSVIFRCFKETSLDNLKVVWLGLSPYFTPNVADGLVFSCSNTGIEQPSLKILLDALENDLGYKDERNPDLKRWANQGVLMLNSSLTTLPGDAKCHIELWKPFMEFLFKEVFNREELVIVFFGKDSQEYSQYLVENCQKVIKVNHPSFYARNSQPMITNLFSETNKQLKFWNKSEIQWMEFGELPWVEEKIEEYKEFI